MLNNGMIKDKKCEKMGKWFDNHNIKGIEL